MHRIPEVQRIFGLVLLLGLLAAFFFMFRDRTPRVVERVFAASQTPASAPAETPGERERRLEERAALVRTLHEGALATVVDGADFGETQGYRRLLEILAAYPPEAVTERVEGPLDYDLALRDPDAQRGRFVRVRGVVAWTREAIRLRDPVAGRDDVYRGILMKADGSEGVAFDLIDPPPDFEARWDVVEIDGILYRTVRYETEKGRHREVPYVLARTLRKTDLRRPDERGSMAVVAVLVLALGVSLGIMLRSKRRRRRPGVPLPRAGFRQMFDQKLREERRKAASERKDDAGHPG